MSGRQESKTLPVILLALSAAAIIASVVLMFYGIYFFFFFIPIAFGIPWSVKRLWKRNPKKQWNVEDLR